MVEELVASFSFVLLASDRESSGCALDFAGGIIEM
jgi:hypothetical protein